MTTDVPPTGRSKHPPLVKVGTAVVVLAVVVVAALGVRWWTHPALFGGLGDSFRAEPRPVVNAALSTTVIFPKVDGGPETVTIDRVHAVFSKNTSEATATFWICHMGTEEDPIGAVDDPESYCNDIVPFKPGTPFRHGVALDADYLFVTIAPTKAGVAHLARVNVTYRRGAGHLYQRGTESIRVDRKVTAM